MHVIGLILAAIAVGLGGLFLLAKSQKENLGKLYSVSAYIVITVSTLIIIFAIAIGILCCCHGKQGCGDGGCMKNKSEMGCKKGDANCKSMKGSCKSDGNCSASMSGCSSKMESCKMGGSAEGCCKGGGSMSCSMMEDIHGMHGEKMTKKVIKTVDGETGDVDVKVITK